MSTSVTPALHLRIHDLSRDGYIPEDIGNVLGLRPRTVKKYISTPIIGSSLNAIDEHKLVVQRSGAEKAARCRSPGSHPV